MIEIMIPFSKAGCWWEDNKGNRGIQVRKEIFFWLRDSNISCSRSFCTLNRTVDEWEISFRFLDRKSAMLFKMRWA